MVGVQGAMAGTQSAVTVGAGTVKGLNRSELAPGLATAPSRVVPGPPQEKLPFASQLVLRLKADLHRAKGH